MRRVRRVLLMVVLMLAITGMGAAQSFQLVDDFNDGTITEWSIVQGDWTEANGYLQPTTKGGDDNDAKIASDELGQEQDLTVRTTFQMTNDLSGILGRLQSNASGANAEYYMAVMGAANGLQVYHHDSGGFTRLDADTDFGVAENSPYNMTLSIEGNEINVTVTNSSGQQGQDVVTDSKITSAGYWGLRSNNDNEAEYDAFYVKTDNLPPVYNQVSTSPDPWMFNDSIDVEANVTDPDGSVQSVSADVLEDGQLVQQDVSLTEQASGNWSVSDLFTVDSVNVYYNVTLTATDNDGATTTTEISQYINNTRPGVSIGQPENQTYEGTSVDYAVTVNSDGDDVEMEAVNLTFYNDTVPFRSIQVNEANNTTTTGTLTVDSDGLHNFTVLGNETGLVQQGTGGGVFVEETNPVSNSTFYTTESTVAYLAGFSHAGEKTVTVDSVEYFEDSFTVIMLGLLIAILFIGALSTNLSR